MRDSAAHILRAGTDCRRGRDRSASRGVALLARSPSLPRRKAVRVSKTFMRLSGTTCGEADIVGVDICTEPAKGAVTQCVTGPFSVGDIGDQAWLDPVSMGADIAGWWYIQRAGVAEQAFELGLREASDGSGSSAADAADEGQATVFGMPGKDQGAEYPFGVAAERPGDHSVESATDRRLDPEFGPSLDVGAVDSLAEDSLDLVLSGDLEQRRGRDLPVWRGHHSATGQFQVQQCAAALEVGEGHEILGAQVEQVEGVELAGDRTDQRGSGFCVQPALQKTESGDTGCRLRCHYLPVEQQSIRSGQIRFSAELRLMQELS